jgi:putative transposase
MVKQRRRHSGEFKFKMSFEDEQYTRTPFYDRPCMTAHLRKQQGLLVNHKRVQRLMQIMGLQALYLKPRTTVARAVHPL